MLKYKRREDFTDEEWKELVKEAVKLNISYDWGKVRIAKELGISPNTVADWIYRDKFLSKVDYIRDGIFEDEIKAAIKTLKEEREEIERNRVKKIISKEEAEKEPSSLSSK